MSDIFYPMAGFRDLQVQYMDRTMKDEFEDGSESAMRLWPDKFFKRQFTAQHYQLSAQEFGYVKSFFTARSGQYDSFWFRDNVNRQGNAKVRLSKPLAVKRNGQIVYDVSMEMREIAPVRMLVELNEVIDVAGNLYFWWDANRATYFRTRPSGLADVSTVAALESTVWDSSYNGIKPAWNTADPNLFVDSENSQYNYFEFGNVISSRFARSTFTLPFATGKPSLTMFIIAKIDGASAVKRVLASIGALGATKAFGIQCDTDGFLKPWFGATETWTNGKFAADSNWHSIAVSRMSGSDTVGFAIDGAFVGTDTLAGSLTDNGFALGSAPDASGTYPLYTDTLGQIAHVICCTSLDVTPMAALHNLFAHQYGLTPV